MASISLNVDKGYMAGPFQRLENNMAPHLYKEKKRRHGFANGIGVEIDGSFFFFGHVYTIHQWRPHLNYTYDTVK